MFRNCLAAAVRSLARSRFYSAIGDILRLLLWQFTRPVLWSILIAWVVAGTAMRHWLQGFAYHVDLDPWLLLAAAGSGLVIALSTVAAHCYLVARARPLAALRYE